MRSPSEGRNGTGTRHRRTRIRSFVAVVQTLILLGVSASVGVALALFIELSSQLPTVGDFEPPEATIIYSSDRVILGRIYQEDRTNVPLKDIPQHMLQATVAIEDSRFYQHSGVDMKGIVRAVWQNLRGARQGGSTITQQLARNVYLTKRKTIERKLQEIVLAILMERNFTKDKILELYLNQVYYGSGAFGVQAAARVYFGKDVDKLSLAEAAMIAGMPQRPSFYSPHENINAATGRRNMVLAKMYEQGYITAEKYDKARNDNLKVITKATGRNTYKASHFVDYVTAQLRDKFGDDVLFRGGLRVYTTLNYEMQKIAEKALREGVKKHEKLRKVSEGCFVAIEPANGYIRAMVGSVDPASQFNRCTQARRQPGSSFKAFVYTAALMSGKNPSSRVLDAPIALPTGNGDMWRPRNYDGKYRGSITYKTAVAMSVNTAAVRVAHEVGIQNVIKYARLMGIESPLEPYMATSIGGIGGLRPMEMASAYGTFANDGVHVDTCSIIRITNGHGELVEDYLPAGHRAIPEKVNAMMDEMFRAVVTEGTGKNARVIAEARGKTGTTNDDIDAWFLGYVPHKLSVACWVGNDNYSPMRRTYGGLVCAPIWAEFMAKAIPILDKIRKESEKADSKNKAVKKQEKPSDDEPERVSKPDKKDDDSNIGADVVSADDDLIPVRVCTETRNVATANCPTTRTERFLRGTEPKSPCKLHSQRAQPVADPERQVDPDETLVTIKVCSETGLLAGQGCPSTVRKRVPVGSEPAQVCNTHNRLRE